MKSYTPYLRVAMALLLTMILFNTRQIKAECGFTISTRDTSWVFSATAGTTQSRNLYVVNTTDSTITVNAAITGSTRFELNHSEFTIHAGDTAVVVITFQPPQGATPGTVNGKLILINNH